MRRYHLNTSHLQLSPGYATKTIVVSISKRFIMSRWLGYLAGGKVSSEIKILMFRHECWSFCAMGHLFNLIGAGFISYPQWEFPWEGIFAGVHMLPWLWHGLWADKGVYSDPDNTGTGQRWPVTRISGTRGQSVWSVSNAGFVNIIGQSRSLHPPL